MEDKYVLITPTKDIVNQYNSWFDQDSCQDKDFKVSLFEEPSLTTIDIRCYYNGFFDWKKSDESIQCLVEQKNIVELFKMINAIYSTRLKTEEISKNLEWKELIDGGVDGLVRRCKEKVGKNAYSFATKVFSFIGEKQYPILDSYVATLLDYYLDVKLKGNDVKNRKEYKKNTWGNYQEYKKAYDRFKELYTLNNFSYKQTDIFLWIYGKAIQEYWRQRDIENGILKFNSVSYAP